MTWRALLKELDGRVDRYAGMLKGLQQPSQTGRTSGERALAGNDEALAAVAVLQGSRAARPFAEAAAPVVTRASHKLALAPASIDPLSVLMLFSISAICETIGNPLPQPPFDANRQMNELLVQKMLSRADRVTLALLSLGLNRLDDVRPIVSQEPVSKDPADPVAIIRSIAVVPRSPTAMKDAEDTWNGFVRAFPDGLNSGTTEWRHLLLAARALYPILGQATVSDVADSLHTLIVRLAAEEQS